MVVMAVLVVINGVVGEAAWVYLGALKVVSCDPLFFFFFFLRKPLRSIYVYVIPFIVSESKKESIVCVSEPLFFCVSLPFAQLIIAHPSRS